MLKAIRLQNFKSFRDTQVPLGRFTLVVGTNASGKSNLRDALRVLHGVGLGYTMPEVLGGKYGDGGVRQWRGIRGGPPEVTFGATTRFAVGAMLDTPLGAFSYQVGAEPHDARLGPRVDAEVLAFEPGTAEERVLYAAHSGAGGEVGAHTLVVDLSRNGGDYPEVSSALPALSVSWDEYDRSELEESCSAVRHALRAMRFLDLDPDTMRRPSTPGTIMLGDRGENFSSVLQAIWQDVGRRAQLLGWIRGLTPMDVVELLFKPDLQGRILVYFRESTGQEISAVSASDGTLRFLALAAALLSPDSGRLYFFEELDNGIHPTRLHLLLNLVQQACSHSDVQVIATTHNPALLGLLDAKARNDAVLAFRPDGEMDTRLQRIVDLPDAVRILGTQDLARLHASGWLEDAATFAQSDGERP